MEPPYDLLGSSNNSSARGERKITTQSGIRRTVGCVLYSVLVLLLVILLMVTGIKFSQLSKDIADVKLDLQKIGHGGKTSLSTSAGAAAVNKVYLPSLVPVRGTCREGWVSFQNSCYMLSSNTLTWQKAEDKCQTLGGHLVVLNSVEELDYLSKIVEIRNNYWIGLVERQHPGHWSWVDGTDLTSTPTFWDIGQPDDWDYTENGEDCGQLHSSDRRMRKLWNDADCKLQCQYICETRQ